MVQGKSITAKLGAGIYFRAAARAQSIADTVFFRTSLATVEQDSFFAGRITMSANGSKTEVTPLKWDVCSTPESRHRSGGHGLAVLNLLMAGRDWPFFICRCGGCIGPK
jgi:hypothetical protein